MTQRKVTISFDDGPHLDHTPVVLDVLAQHGVKSSFFSICSKLQDPELLALAARAVQEGHWYGSHSYFHKTPLGWMEDFGDAVAEIDLGFEVLGQLAGPREMYRPFGFGGVLDQRMLNPVAVSHLQQRKSDCVIWDFTPTEWKNVDGWVALCLTACREREWTCLALRDSEATIGRHLGELIVALRNEGYEIVQDFPEHVVPIREGRILADLTELIARKD